MDWVTIARTCVAHSFTVTIPMPVMRNDIPVSAWRAMESVMSALYGTVIPSSDASVRDVRFTFLWRDDGTVTPAVASHKSLHKIANIVPLWLLGEVEVGHHDAVVTAMAAALAEYVMAIAPDLTRKAEAWLGLAIARNVVYSAGGESMLITSLALDVSVDTMMRVAREHDDQEALGELVAELEKLVREHGAERGQLTFGVFSGHVKPALVYEGRDGVGVYKVPRRYVSGIAELAALSDAPQGIALWKQLAELLTRSELE